MRPPEDLLANATSRLEDSWRAGKRADLPGILGDLSEEFSLSESAGQRLLCDLIKADMSLRWPVSTSGAVPADDASGEFALPTLETYLDGLGDAAFDDEAVLALIEHEYRLRIASGDIPDVDELTNRFDWLDPATREQVAALRDALLVESSIRVLLHDSDPLERPPVDGPAKAPVFLNEHEHREPSATTDEESLADALKQAPPFCDLTQFLRDAISEKLVVQRFEEGDVLLRQGEAADSLLIVLDGAVDVLLEDTGQRHTIARVGRHTVVGEIGMVTRELRSANVVAATAGRAATIGRDDFEHIAGRYPRLSIAMSELIAERVGTLTIDVLSGKTIGGYKIAHRLGRGGMGIVYFAWDSEGQPIALKMLRHDLTFDRVVAQRFHLEAEVVRSLQHPNIVRVVDEFSTFGTSFIAMELCDGPSLSELLRHTGALPQPVVRALIGQLATGLCCAHAAGVTHRDLKPSNVMLTRDGMAKLVDFGLARSPSLPNAELTATGQIMGTPRYMAPEQLNGERGDALSDIFSLGGLAYELLTGGPLFKGTQWQELFRERALWKMPPPEEIRSGLDGDLFDFLKSSLVEEPRLRTVELPALTAWAAPVEWMSLLDDEAAGDAWPLPSALCGTGASASST